MRGPNSSAQSFLPAADSLRTPLSRFTSVRSPKSRVAFKKLTKSLSAVSNLCPTAYPCLVSRGQTLIDKRLRGKGLAREITGRD